MAQEEMYGYFPGGDPRRFRPDVESATIEEIAYWKEMCRFAAEEEKHGGRMSCPPAHQAGEIEHEGVRRPAWINTGRFGPGSWYEDTKGEEFNAEGTEDVVAAKLPPYPGDEDWIHVTRGYLISEES